MINNLKNNYLAINQQKPLILNITNLVTIDFMANALLALGASPIMSFSEDEIVDLLKITNGININLGTLNSAFLKVVDSICQNKPDNIVCVLDPVGSGASKYRTDNALKYSHFADIIKANATEILSLGSTKIKSCGVDAQHDTSDTTLFAVDYAKVNQKIIAITGKNDFITNGLWQQNIGFGNSIMSRITGMGCVLGAVMTAFASVNNNYYQATCNALIFYNLVAEYTFQSAKLPSSFKMKFIDNLYQPNWDFIEQQLHKI